MIELRRVLSIKHSELEGRSRANVDDVHVRSFICLMVVGMYTLPHNAKHKIAWTNHDIRDNLHMHAILRLR